jgi:hypothetical protein
MIANAGLDEATEEAFFALGGEADVFPTIFAAFASLGHEGTDIDHLIGGATVGIPDHDLPAIKRRAAKIQDPWAAWESNRLTVEQSATGKTLKRLLRLHAPQEDAEDDWDAQAVDLADLMGEEDAGVAYLPTVELGPDLFYGDSMWTVSAHRGTGKSWILASVAHDAMKAGRKVVYLDFENGGKRFARRMTQAGVPRDLVRAQFKYLPFVKGLSTETMYRQLRRQVEQNPGVIVIVDSFRGYFARVGDGMNVKDRTDMERVLNPIREAIEDGNLTVAVIDHTTKNGSENDTYATADSGAKEEIYDAVYFVTEVRPYNIEKSGVLRITVKKDRDGELPLTRSFHVGGQGKGGVFRFIPMSDEEVNGALSLLHDIRQHFEKNPGTYFTKTDVRKLPGDSNKIDAALRVLFGGEEEAAGFYLEPNPEGKTKTVAYIFDPERE